MKDISFKQEGEEYKIGFDSKIFKVPKRFLNTYKENIARYERHKAFAEAIKIADKRIKILEKEMKKYEKPEKYEFYARINELKELKLKLQETGGMK